MGGVISIFQTQKPVQRGSWALPPPCLLPSWPAEGELVVVARTRSRSSASKAELYLPDPAASWSLLERIALRNEHHSKLRSLGWKGLCDSPPPLPLLLATTIPHVFPSQGFSAARGNCEQVNCFCAFLQAFAHTPSFPLLLTLLSAWNYSNGSV